MNVEQAPGGPDREPNPWMRAGKVLVSIAAVVSMLSGDSSPHSRRVGSTAESVRKLSESERRALHALQCRQVDIARRAASKSEGVGRRRREDVLKGVSDIASCVEYDSATFAPSTVCIAVQKAIDENPKSFFGRNSVLAPLLQSLYLELKCQGVGKPESQAPIAVKELFSRLKVEIDRDPPKILDPKTTLKDLCLPGLQIVREHQTDISTIGDYLLANYQSSPILKGRIEKWRENRTTKLRLKSPPTDEELTTAFKTTISKAIVSARTARALCFAPEFLSQLFRADIDEINRQRREIFPQLRALVETLSKDLEAKKPEAEKAYAALQRIALSVARVK